MADKERLVEIVLGMVEDVNPAEIARAGISMSVVSADTSMTSRITTARILSATLRWRVNK